MCTACSLVALIDPSFRLLDTLVRDQPLRQPPLGPLWVKHEEEYADATATTAAASTMSHVDVGVRSSRQSSGRRRNGGGDSDVNGRGRSRSGDGDSGSSASTSSASTTAAAAVANSRGRSDGAVAAADAANSDARRDVVSSSIPPVGERLKHFVFRLLRRLRTAASIDDMSGGGGGSPSWGGGGGGGGGAVLNGTSRIILMGQPVAVSYSALQVFFDSILWFSYRSNFPLISRSMYSSDTGWGCMLRSLQMVIAQAFQRHLSDTEWNARTGAGGVGGGALAHPDACRIMRSRIISLFADDPVSPYSIHRLVQLGDYYGKKPGQWYGPVLASHLARNANEMHLTDDAEKVDKAKKVKDGATDDEDQSGGSILATAGPLAIFTAHDGVINVEEIESYFFGAQGTDTGVQPGRGVHHGGFTAFGKSGPAGVGGNATAAAAAVLVEGAGGGRHSIGGRSTSTSTSTSGGGSGASSGFSSTTATSANTTSRTSACGDSGGGAGDSRAGSGSGSTSRVSTTTTTTSTSTTTTTAAPQEWRRSLLLLVPLRLGVRHIAQHHLAMLRGTLQLPHSVGFIGGSPAHSLYFVAADEHGRFAYLDPHVTQRALLPRTRLRFWQNSAQAEVGVGALPRLATQS